MKVALFLLSILLVHFSAEAQFLKLGEDVESFVNSLVNNDYATAALKLRAEAELEKGEYLKLQPDPVINLSVLPFPIQTRVGAMYFQAGFQRTLFWKEQLEARFLEKVASSESLLEKARATKLLLRKEVIDYLIKFSALKAIKKVLEEQREHYIFHRDIVQALYNQNKVSQRAFVRINTVITEIETQITNIDRKIKAVEGLLEALAGYEIQEVPVILLSVPEKLSVKAEDFLLQQFPSIKELEKKKEMLEYRKKYIALEKRPLFSLGVNYSLIVPYEGRSIDIPFFQDDADDSLSLFVRFNIPNKKRVDFKLTEVDLALDALDKEIEEIIQTFQERIFSISSSIPNLFSEWKLVKEVLFTQAQQTLETTTKDYTQGKAVILDVLDAVHLFFSLRIRMIQLQEQYTLYLNELDFIKAYSYQRRM